MRSKRAVSNTIALIVLQIISLICGFIVPRLIISNFGSDVNGLVASIGKFLTYISLIEFGFGPVVKSILYKPIAKKNKSEIEKILKAAERFFRHIALIFLVYVLVLCFVIPFIVKNDFSFLYMAPLVIIIAFSVFIEYFFGMTYKIYLITEQKTYITSLIQMITLIINAAVCVILIKIGAGIHAVKLATAIIFATRPFIQNYYIKKKYNLDFKDKQTDYKIKQKWDGLAQHIAYVVRVNTDIIVLTIFTQIKEVSVYYVYSMVTTGVKGMLESFSAGVEASFGDIIAKKETKVLNKSFRIYEFIYLTISTIAFICTLFLIVPFISVYTKGITDVNYIRPLFACIFVIAEFVYIIRLPYSSITVAAGKFKEIRIPAWIESIVNIVISLALVIKLGIVGVAIGTLAAMITRTAHFMYYASKNILKRNMMQTIKYIILEIIEFLLVMVIIKVLPNMEVTNYLEWIKQGLIVFGISFIVVGLINSIVCIKELKETIEFLKNHFKGVKE